MDASFAHEIQRGAVGRGEVSRSLVGSFWPETERSLGIQGYWLVGGVCSGTNQLGHAFALDGPR